MDILINYSKLSLSHVIKFDLIQFMPEKNTWKYKLVCAKPINDAEKLDQFFKEFYHFIGDLILDGYEVEISGDFNFLLKK